LGKSIARGIPKGSTGQLKGLVSFFAEKNLNDEFISRIGECLQRIFDQAGQVTGQCTAFVPIVRSIVKMSMKNLVHPSFHLVTIERFIGWTKESLLCHQAREKTNKHTQLFSRFPKRRKWYKDRLAQLRVVMTRILPFDGHGSAVDGRR
jgi:hypothetical protein